MTHEGNIKTDPKSRLEFLSKALEEALETKKRFEEKLEKLDPTASPRWTEMSREELLAGISNLGVSIEKLEASGSSS